ncbi:hypothetical protein PSH55_21310 [Pseudoalteromonas sp. Angola-31]|nr:hypothetical protein [Pseudoalteromonas sp. Angola-31]
MDNLIKHAFQTVISNWDSMQNSDLDEAEEAANRFEASFYIFIDQLKEWFHMIDPKPQTLELAMLHPDLKTITLELPAPLQIPFETELELILEGIIRESDSKYD